MNNTDELTSAYALADRHYQSYITAKEEAYNTKVALIEMMQEVTKLTDENSKLKEEHIEICGGYSIALEEAILDRDMYKQHSLDLAKELEQMREPEWDDEEDYLPAPAEGCQCSYCKGE